MARIQQIQLRRGTAAAWTSANPTLAAGELGQETDTGKLKTGDGSTVWTALAYLVTTGTTAGTVAAGNDTRLTRTWAAYGDVLAALAYNRTGVLSGCVVGQHATQTAATYRGHATALSSNSATKVLTLSAATVAGDSVLVVLYDTFGTVTGIAGCGATFTKVQTSGSHQLWRGVGATAGGTVVTITSSGSNFVTALAVAIGGTVASTAQASGGAATTVTAPSVTPTAVSQTVLNFHAQVASSSAVYSGYTDTPAAYTTVDNFTDTGQVRQASSYYVATNLTATYRAATSPQSAAWAAFAVVINGPAAAPNMSVDVAAGVVSSAGVSATAAGATVAVTAADATNPRLDLVSVSAAGTAVITTGTPAAAPVWPTLPTGNAALAVVSVPANLTAVLNAHITDLRTVLSPDLVKSAATRAYTRNVWR